MKIQPALFPDDLVDIRQLLREYNTGLGIDLSFQNFESELASLPGEYAPTRGAFLMARVDGAVAGCVALRPIDTQRCEMKRLFLRPSFRRSGQGRELAGAIISLAAQLGYSEMLLDTLLDMHTARNLYSSLGFVETEPYRPPAREDLVFYKLAL